jgi:hypothetical protein
MARLTEIHRQQCSAGDEVGLAVKKTAKESWDSVKKMRDGDEHVKAANMQSSSS